MDNTTTSTINNIKASVQQPMQMADCSQEINNRFIEQAATIHELYHALYGQHQHQNTNYIALLNAIGQAAKLRPERLVAQDLVKAKKGNWFLSNQIVGMSLYVDRFCNNLKTLEQKLNYFEELGVNLLHLMPIFQSPENESDGGYAVSNFRAINSKFGTIEDLNNLQNSMNKKELYLMLDIVFNHTSNQHEWAQKAKNGDAYYQDFFYMYNDRQLPDAFEKTMPEIFPESAPGSFTYIPECNKWAMTVFHNYQWDLNFSNPAVFVAMLENVLYLANLGVDILRIDAPAFIWKQLGTNCQNLPQAHQLLQLLKCCVQVAAPGLALLAEAIVAPTEIMKYFGTAKYAAKECDFAYNATLMALQWDALATKDVRIMQQAIKEVLPKPFGTTWITYTRCHDDIGLGYDDKYISQAGFNAYEHRKYLKNYYSGVHQGSTAVGALFGYNPKTQDARISGSLASLCGLEKAMLHHNAAQVDIAISKIILMQALSFFVGGVPMLFYGDEIGYTNDYNYQNDAAKSYDNRWMHRPVIRWNKNEMRHTNTTIEHRIFTQHQLLIRIRKKLPALADFNNLDWIDTQNIHVVGIKRKTENQTLYCFFNFDENEAALTWYLFNAENRNATLTEHWQQISLTIGPDNEHLILPPYSFKIIEISN
jgi:amylosucrase